MALIGKTRLSGFCCKYPNEWFFIQSFSKSLKISSQTLIEQNNSTVTEKKSFNIEKNHSKKQFLENSDHQKSDAKKRCFLDFFLKCEASDWDIEGRYQASSNGETKRLKNEIFETIVPFRNTGLSRFWLLGHSKELDWALNERTSPCISREKWVATSRKFKTDCGFWQPLNVWITERYDPQMKPKLTCFVLTQSN